MKRKSLNMKLRNILSAVVVIFVAVNALGQSKSFRLGKWLEINDAILKELSRNYVDSLPLDRIERKGIDAMLAALDPYTIYIPEEEDDDLRLMINKTYGGVGAIIFKPEKDGYVYINEPYANSPAVKAGLRSGDRIMSIDGVNVKGLDTKECSDKMRGKPGTVVKFKVLKVHTGVEKDVTVTRERIHLPDVEYSGMLNDTTGYILQTGFTDNVSGAIRNAFNSLKKQGMRRLIYDLRGNGGGLMYEAINIVSLFVPKGSLVVSQKGKNDENREEYRTVIEPLDAKMPITVLVDGGSASSSEIVAGALQDLDRAVIMGKRTYGKGLVQSIVPLPYNGKMKITTAKYYTPSGRCVQAIDYTHRNEDGSVGQIPDSLTKEFKTLKGRIVRDGGGITPDVKLDAPNYSRLVYSLVVSGIIDQYALDYTTRHETIPAIDDFHFNDYEDFINFAKGKKFDYRSNAKALYDKMKTELKLDGLDGGLKKELEALDKVIDMEKEQFLRMKKDEIIPFIEEEIAVRYYYHEAGIKIRIRYDTQLKKCVNDGQKLI